MRTPTLGPSGVTLRSKRPGTFGSTQHMIAIAAIPHVGKNRTNDAQIQPHFGWQQPYEANLTPLPLAST